MGQDRNKNDGLPRGWAQPQLEACVDILDGRRVPVNAKERQKRIAGKTQAQLYPYYGATGQVGWIDESLFDEELVLLGEDGAPFFDFSKAKAYVIRNKTWVNNHAHVLRAIAGLIASKYLCHYLNVFDYHGAVAGTTRLKLNQAPMRRIPIALAPFPEQKRIVAKVEELFTKLDAGVEGLKKVKAELKRYRQAVLKAAFEGKLTAGWREKNKDKLEPASKLLERIAKEREKTAKGKAKKLPPLDKSDLPELPEGWEWASVMQLGCIGEQTVLTGPFGSTLGREDFVDSGVSLLTIGCLTERGVMPEKGFCVTADKARELGRYRLREGDILFSRSASVGRAGFVTHPLAGSVINYHLMRLRLAPAVMDPHCFIYYVRGAATVRDYLRDVNHGATRDGVNTADLLSMPVAVPAASEQIEVVAEIERHLSIADEVEQAVDKGLKEAERLRQSILKKAFEGKLVPQYPNDEPADKLLERIKAEKAKKIVDKPQTKALAKGQRR